MATQIWRRTRSAFLDLIFPPRCSGCGRPGQWLCARCIAAIHYIEEPICRRCGDEIGEDGRCASCRGHPLPLVLTRVRAVARYEGTVRRAIHALKFQRLTAIADPLGDLLAGYLAKNPMPFSLIVPVPLHVERERERGYNQAALLAAVVSQRSGFPLDSRCLVRRRNTPPQVGLDVDQRIKNIAGAVECIGGVDGQHVLIIDDVCTTGATLSECARALHAAGAITILGLTLAR